LLTELGFTRVETYLASGNAVLTSHRGAEETRARIELALPHRFKLDREVLRVLVLTRDQLQAVIDNRPRGFGDQPGKYHSDAIFLMGLESDQAISVFSPREGVDKVWPGDGVIYSQRLSAMRTKSRLSRIAATPAYQDMTIRNWNTTTALLELATRMESEEEHAAPGRPQPKAKTARKLPHPGKRKRTRPGV
jgi:uncharacterized protein (DUF1697 family)